MRKTLIIALFVCLLPLSLFAQKKSDKIGEAKKLYTNLRLGLFNLFFGRLPLQYELQLGKSSLNLNGSISFASDQKGYLAGMGYRYYFSSKRTSAFVGVIANFSDYKKEYEGTIADGQPNAGTKTDFRLWGQTITAGANVGYRKSFFFGLFNITARIGYGYPIQINDLSWQGVATPQESDTFKQRYTFASGLDAEFSFGWHFRRQR